MTKKTESLREKAKALDKALAEFVSEVYDVSGMAAPGFDAAATFAFTEAAELLEEVYGSGSPMVLFAKSVRAIADLHVARSGKWKRSHPEDINEKEQRAIRSLNAYPALKAMLMKCEKGKCKIGTIADAQTYPRGRLQDLALEAGQTVLMAWQAAVPGEEDGVKITGPMAAVAEWAIKLGEREE